MKSLYLPVQAIDGTWGYRTPTGRVTGFNTRFKAATSAALAMEDAESNYPAPTAEPTDGATALTTSAAAQDSGIFSN